MTALTIKLLGSAFLLFSSICYGEMHIRSDRLKTRDIEAVIDIIKYISEKIEYFSAPLPEIFLQYSNDHFEKTGVLEEIRRSGIKFLCTDNKLSISQEDRDLLSKFASELGKSYVDEELALCRYTYEKLKESEAKLRETQKSREKLYRTIPPMVVLSLILIII